MTAPTLQQLHNFASDISCRRVEIRNFTFIANYIISLNPIQQRSLLRYLADTHPFFEAHYGSVLPRAVQSL